MRTIRLSLPLLFVTTLLWQVPAHAADPIDREESWVAGRRNYWAFRKVQRPAVPAIPDPWVRTPIDAFLREAQIPKALTPSAPLDKARLLRRLSLDLIGLPPTPAEVDRFVRDRSPGAYAREVDRLLASPHYGERWALRWLDVVRYAESNGYETDYYRPHAWRYRDYVVRSFQQDKPYNRFLKEQIAGDELWPGQPEALIATGFNRAGPIHIVSGNQDEEMNRQEQLTEMAGTIGPVFLGLTVGCARCHNHKFDPILQADYYRMQAIYAGTEFKDVPLASPEEAKQYEAAKKEYDARLKPIEDAIKELEKPYRESLRQQKMAKLDPLLKAALDVPKDKRNPEQTSQAKIAEEQISSTWDEVVAILSAPDREKRAGLRRQRLTVKLTEPDPPTTAFAVANMDKTPPTTHILKVGDYHNKLDPVDPGFPRVLCKGCPPLAPAAAGRRAALAEWLASPEHPLTARVMVNRIWQFRMGTGLVRTPNDFGVLGDRPSNQKLIDWLASEFVEKNWSVKTIDRLIVLSSAYQQSATQDAAKAAIDPDNRLYWRMNRRRLEGEILRDQVLAVSGALNPKLGGKPVLVPIEKEVYDLIFSEAEPDDLWPVTPDVSEHSRRSLYLLNKRTIRLPMMANFDQPDTMTSCPVRPTSTHALQSLSLFNSDFMQQQSATFAKRLETACGTNRSCQVTQAYQLALARPPQPVERKQANHFLSSGAPLVDFCLALLNRNEFVYLP